ncbi:hypothetical protein TRAPUB_2474 [Trametes pubescens]|uniref:Uncharacterized protein n=1 Tax=Trametes pubescens TaxID=154538 RepID=A0A1M2VGE4_TRAPU|nr:hypothetical protein TRAPUB_2474 [Trametes pubescens]
MSMLSIVLWRAVPRGALTCKEWMNLGHGIQRAHQRRQAVDKRVDTVQEDAQTIAVTGGLSCVIDGAYKILFDSICVNWLVNEQPQSFLLTFEKLLAEQEH